MLAQPFPDEAPENPGHDAAEDHDEKRQVDGQVHARPQRQFLRQKRERHRIAVGHGQHHERDRDRDQKQVLDGADHLHLVPRTTSQPSRPFNRSLRSLPALKNGTCFSSTSTLSPVRGLRPMRASRFFTENAPKPRSSTRFPLAKSLGDLFEYRVHDAFNVALVEMRVFIRELLNELRAYHDHPPDRAASLSAQYRQNRGVDTGFEPISGPAASQMPAFNGDFGVIAP
jgi:hypothetical protein